MKKKIFSLLLALGLVMLALAACSMPPAACTNHADANGDHVTAIVETPGELNVSNYAAYLSGDHTFSSATAKSQNCGYISSISATPQYAN